MLAADEDCGKGQLQLQKQEGLLKEGRRGIVL